MWGAVKGNLLLAFGFGRVWDLNVDDDDAGQHDEMADLCELTLEDLMALRTKCGRWLKHIELEMEERRQEPQDIMDQQEAEREAEVARRGRLRAEVDPQAPQYDPSMPPEDGD